ncbi:Deoxyribodipyrimidine photo-lyase [compost metagenome]
MFNPTLQTEKFDKEHQYIEQWVPEYQSPEYPMPMVEHTFARERVLKVYKKALN